MSLVNVVCFQVEVSTSGRSPVQRSPTECGASRNLRKLAALARAGQLRQRKKITKLLLHVRPAKQLTIMFVTFATKNFGHPCFRVYFATL